MTNLTPSTSQTDELDILAIKTAFMRRVRERCPDHEAFAIALLGRLTPERWQLEWHAPWWVGHAFGLDPAVSQELVLSNVLGLASIRLEDDLGDGEIQLHEVSAAREVRAALFDAAVEPYRRRFSRDSPFWDYFGRFVGAAARQRGSSDEPRGLASVGAPLKVAVVAACLLSNRDAHIPEVEGLFDDAIESLVLDDHVADWEADVAAGRWNAFVDSVVPRDRLADRAAVRRAVLVAMLTTDVLPRTFTTIVAGFQRAAGTARGLDPALAPLAEALLRMADDARHRGAGITRHYRTLGDQAAKLLLSPPKDGRS